jgi:hypothetical protein
MPPLPARDLLSNLATWAVPPALAPAAAGIELYSEDPQLLNEIVASLGSDGFCIGEDRFAVISKLGYGFVVFELRGERMMNHSPDAGVHLL